MDEDDQISPLRAELWKKARNVKELLKKAIDYARLSLDLAFNAIVYGDEELAEEVLEIEREMDKVELQILAWTALAVRNRREAEEAVSVYKLASSLNKISDAASDLAKAYLDYRPAFNFDVPVSNGDEIVARLIIGTDLEKPVESVLKEHNIVIDILAIRKDGEWDVEPPLTIKPMKNEVLIVKGSRGAVETFARAIGSEIKRKAAPPLEVSSQLLELGKIVGVMFSLALAALLMRAEKLARQVEDLEGYVDEYLVNFEKMVLSSNLRNNEKGAYLFAAFAIEHIADSALEMVSPVLMGLRPHPLLMDVLDETKERISVIEMEEADEGCTLAELGYHRKGILVLAVKRGREWLLMPPYTDFKIRSGDILLVKYYEESEDYVEIEERKEDREDIIEDVWEEATEG